PGPRAAPGGLAGAVPRAWGLFTAHPCGARGWARAKVAAAAARGTLEVRCRRGGERLRPAGHRPHRSLKTLLAEAQIPPWERHRVPLLWADHQLIAIADGPRDVAWQAAPLEPGLVLQWQKPLPSANVDS
ncbi:MAG: tRNA lysidine(34) synthetase TilS, partial [Candidatus Competibacterales bacterium]